MEDLSAWPTKQDVVTLTGHSLRTVERLITAGKLKTGYRRVPGRRPLVVVDPDSLKRLTQETVKPEPVTQLPAKPTKPEPGLLNMLMNGNGHVPLRDRLYLNLKEASELSGLTVAFLRRQIAAGSLPAIRDVSTKVKREDLFRL